MSQLKCHFLCEFITQVRYPSRVLSVPSQNTYCCDVFVYGFVSVSARL